MYDSAASSVPGNVLVYDHVVRSNPHWRNSTTPSASTTDDFFGALALAPDTVLVSTPHPVINGNSFQGAAYFFERIPDGQ